MATSSQISTDLQLPILPELTDADPRLYNEFVKIYNAIKILAYNLDRYTGLEHRDAVSQAQYSVSNSNSTYLLSNSTKLYKVFGETINYGSLVAVDGAGHIVKSHSLDLANIALFKRCIGFCSSQGTVNAGDVGEVTCIGILTTTGLNPSSIYYTYTNGTVLDLHNWNFGVYQLPSAAVLQQVGIALSTTELLLFPEKQAFKNSADALSIDTIVANLYTQ